jgi:formate hydrogenlyase subunit 3/multisubunit Na+/H+ antiporter MnhD subunit
MFYALAILILTAIVCFALGFGTNRGSLSRIIAVAGTGIALAIALEQEWLQGTGAMIAWPDFMGGLGPSFYRSDTLATGLGAWCILLGGLCLLKLDAGETIPWRYSAAVMSIATLYSLVYTVDLRVFAVQVLLLMLLTWAVLWGVAQNLALVARQRAVQMLGALALLGAVLLMGRTTGGVYSLGEMSLSALTLWPLLLIGLFVLLWLGLAPFTGWSSLVDGSQTRGTRGALLQGLLVGVPSIVLLLRLEALITAQAPAGSVPVDWTWFTGGLIWFGGITALAASASSIVWAGSARWSAALTAYTMGIAIWALGLDTPTGRYAAVALVLSYGLGRLVLDLSSGQYGWLSRMLTGLSLVGAPITAGFVGLWLLASGLVESRHPSLVIVLVGAAILAACGAALHLGTDQRRWTMDDSSRPKGHPAHRWTNDRLSSLLALALAAVLLLGGALPGVWVPQVEAMAAIAGGGSLIGTDWTGLLSGGILAPLPLLAGGTLLLGTLGWVVRLWVKSGTSGNSVLLPTAVARLQRAKQDAPVLQPLLSNPPPAVWWLSLLWLESGIYGSVSLVNRMAMRLGTLLARLEGRYYFPLAVIMTLLILLAITR